MVVVVVVMVSVHPLMRESHSTTSQVGRVLRDGLAANRLLASTLVVMLGDHGCATTKLIYNYFIILLPYCYYTTIL